MDMCLNDERPACSNLCNPDANSAEWDKDTPHPVVINMPEISQTILGGTMRLGDRATIFTEHSDKSITRRLYGNPHIIHERHRHRYEVNPKMVQQIEEAGMSFIGKDEKGERMIVLELKGWSNFVESL